MATLSTAPRFTTITLATPSAGPFVLDFRIFGPELTVYLDGIPTELFTLNATFVDGFSDNAEVTLNSAASAGTVIRIESAIPPVRSADYIATDFGLARKLNIEAGRIWSGIADMRRDLARYPTLEVGQSATMELPVAGRALVGNEAGTGFVAGRDISSMEDGADVTDAGNVGSSIAGTSAKATPVDADQIAILDSANSSALAKLTVGALKSHLQTAYAALFQPLSSVLTGTTASFTTALKTKLDGIAADADKTDAATVGTVITAGATKTTPVDADAVAITDSAAGNAVKRVTMANLASFISSTFTLTRGAISGAMNGAVGKESLAALDRFYFSDIDLGGFPNTIRWDLLYREVFVDAQLRLGHLDLSSSGDNTAALTSWMNSSRILIAPMHEVPFSTPLTIPSGVQILGKLILRWEGASGVDPILTIGSSVKVDHLAVKSPTASNLKIEIGAAFQAERFSFDITDNVTAGSHNSHVRMTVNDSTRVGTIDLNRVDRGLDIVSGAGGYIGHLKVRSYLRGLKLSGGGNSLVIDTVDIQTRSPYAVTQVGGNDINGFNGILIETGQHWRIGGGTVQDSVEHGIRIGGSSDLVANFFIGKITTDDIGGCHLKINNSAQRVRYGHVEIEGYGNHNAVDVGTNAAFIRLSHCEHINIIATIQKKIGAQVSCHDLLTLNDATWITGRIQGEGIGGRFVHANYEFDTGSPAGPIRNITLDILGSQSVTDTKAEALRFDMSSNAIAKVALNLDAEILSPALVSFSTPSSTNTTDMEITGRIRTAAVPTITATPGDANLHVLVTRRKSALFNTGGTLS